MARLKAVPYKSFYDNRLMTCFMRGWFDRLDVRLKYVGKLDKALNR